jgi:hypothetical protein
MPVSTLRFNIEASSSPDIVLSTIPIMSNHVAQPETAAANTLVPPTQGEAAGEAFTSKD